MIDWLVSSLGQDPVPKYFYYSPLFPNPAVCLRGIIVTGYKQVYVRLLPWNGTSVWVSETSNEIVGLLEFVDVGILLLTAILGVALTLLQIFLDQVFFQVVQQCNWWIQDTMLLINSLFYKS